MIDSLGLLHTRRQFLRGTVAAAAGLGLGASSFAEAAPLSAFGVQLYTARKDVIADPVKTLQTIRQIGYRCVETFAAEYKSTNAKDLRKMITDAGLALPSAHFGYNEMSQRLDYAKELGVHYVVVGSTPVNIANSVDGFKQAAHQYNQWGEQARKLGLSFAFHNHNTEFQRFDGRTGLDILLAETDPHLVQWQMDCYWVTEAGSDPVQLIRQHGHRLQSLHFKDRKPDFLPSTILGKDAQHFTEVGTGTINWRAIWNAASAVGIKYFFVEQDTTEIPALDSLKISFANLKRLLA
ncbi:sugar phosphate isomerase/epimerase family protein [Edaphobacter acidisoli]|nr:sugar phosphate isomerase/epimerase [Edaphobacter acidisoli]